MGKKSNLRCFDKIKNFFNNSPAINLLLIGLWAIVTGVLSEALPMIMHDSLTLWGLKINHDTIILIISLVVLLVVFVYVFFKCRTSKERTIIVFLEILFCLLFIISFAKRIPNRNTINYGETEQSTIKGPNHAQDYSDTTNLSDNYTEKETPNAGFDGEITTTFQETTNNAIEPVTSYKDSSTLISVEFDMKEQEYCVTNILITDSGEINIPAYIDGYPVTRIADFSLHSSPESYMFVHWIYIPATVTEIGSYAFMGCDDLYEITVDVANPKYKSVDGVLFTKDMTTLLHCPARLIANTYIIPNGVITISECAFYGSEIDIIVIPDTVECIKAVCFRGAYIQNVVIGNGVTDIDEKAFWECNINNIFVKEYNHKYKSIDGSLFTKDESTLILCARSKTEFLFPNQTTAISAYAFQNCYHLTKITINDNITFIGQQAFYNCDELHSIIFIDKFNWFYELSDESSFGSNMYRQIDSINLQNKYEAYQYWKSICKYNWHKIK